MQVPAILQQTQPNLITTLGSFISEQMRVFQMPLQRHQTRRQAVLRWKNTSCSQLLLTHTLSHLMELSMRWEITVWTLAGETAQQRGGSRRTMLL